MIQFITFFFFLILLRIYCFNACFFNRFDCQCSYWTENGLMNAYIGCLGQNFQIDLFDFNEINLSMNYERIEIYIENKNLSILKNLKGNYKIRRLRMRKTGIQLISSDFFVGMTNVEFFHLDSNHISIIEENSFLNCSSLYEINLSYNFINSISSKTFSGAYKLLYLWLTGNQIKYIENNSFDDLRFLKKISLDNNQIAYISTDIFKNQIELEEIYAQNNKISNIESDLFKYTKSLKK